MSDAEATCSVVNPETGIGTDLLGGCLSALRAVMLQEE